MEYSMMLSNLIWKFRSLSDKVDRIGVIHFDIKDSDADIFNY